MREISVNVLGHIYKAVIYLENEIPEDLKEKHEQMSGLCENYTHELIIFQDNQTNTSYKRLDIMQEKVARHELLHAYFHKSGLSQLITKDTEEAIVDMLAINFHKIAYNVECIEKLFKGSK